MTARKIDISDIKNIIKFQYIIEIFVIFIGIILRLKLYLSNPSFFIDECSLGFNVINRSYLELFLPLNVSQCAPPFFLIVSKFILNLSHQYGNIYTQDLALRVFPLFCSIVSLPLFAIFLNKVTTNKVFIWICIAMLALNTCAINYSIQFKQYSCELMFSLILLLIFQLFDINKISKKTLSLYSFIFCISIWFSSTAIVILLTGFMYLCFKCFSKDLRKEIKSNFLKISIILIPFITDILIYYFYYFKVIYYSYVHDFMYNFWTTYLPSFFTIDNFLTLFPKRIQELINIPILNENLLIIFLLINVVILLCVKEGFKLKTKFFIITTILLSVIASFLKIYPFERRLILFSLPLFIILYCQFLYLLKPNKLVKAFTIIILAFISIIRLNTPTLSTYYPLFKQPARNSISFLIQNKIPTNKVIFTVPEEMVDYYTHYLFSKNKPLLFDIYWDGFDKSKLPKVLNNCSKSDYYIFIPFDILTKEYKDNLSNYIIKSNKHLKILNTYSYNGYIYIIHLKKISDFE